MPGASKPSGGTSVQLSKLVHKNDTEVSDDVDLSGKAADCKQSEFAAEESGSGPGVSTGRDRVDESQPSGPDHHHDSLSVLQGEALPVGKPFRAIIRLTTLDERNCPGPKQRARAFEISRKHIGLRTRNMVHLLNRVAVIIDRIDDRSTVVFGRVIRCMYAGAGEYTTVVRFDQVPNWQDVQEWAGSP